MKAGGRAEFGEGRERWLIRTEVVVDEAYSAVAGQVGVPICDGLEPVREGA